MTLGLPFSRTSVDHGTALDLAVDAARARTADPGSLFAAGRSRRRARALAAMPRADPRDRAPSRATSRASATARTSWPIRTTSRASSTRSTPKPGEQRRRDRPGLAALTGDADRARGHDRRDRDRPRSGGRGCASTSRRTSSRCIVADALEFDLTHRWAPSLRVVGNLPYNISSPLPVPPRRTRRRNCRDLT